jgi:hypothetical protein
MKLNLKTLLILCSIFSVSLSQDYLQYEENSSVMTGLFFFFVIYLSMIYNVFNKKLYFPFIEEAISYVFNTSSDEVYKPLVYYIFNILPYIPTIVSSMVF